MGTREGTQPAGALVRLLTLIGRHLAEAARECGYAMLCYPPPSDPTERK